MDYAKCEKCYKSLGVLTSKEVDKYWINTIPYFNRGFLLCYDCQKEFSLFSQEFIQTKCVDEVS